MGNLAVDHHLSPIGKIQHKIDLLFNQENAGLVADLFSHRLARLDPAPESYSRLNPFPAHMAVA